MEIADSDTYIKGKAPGPRNEFAGSCHKDVLYSTKPYNKVILCLILEQLDLMLLNQGIKHTF